MPHRTSVHADTRAPLLNSLNTHTRRSRVHANTVRAPLLNTHTHAARACTPIRARLYSTHTHTPLALARQYARASAQHSHTRSRVHADTRAPLLNTHTRRSRLRARLCLTLTHAARACTPTRASLCPLSPLVGRPVCSHTPRLPYPQNTCHSAKGGWRTHSRRKPYVTSVTRSCTLTAPA